MLVSFGMPMGAFCGERSCRARRLQTDPGIRRAVVGPDDRPDTIEDELVMAGRLGRKNELGWYRYSEGRRAGEPDPELLVTVENHRRQLGRASRSISPDEIIARCLFGVINEGAKTVEEEGVAMRASDVDVAAVYGYGFPRYRGGPMHYADEFGLRDIATTVQSLHKVRDGGGIQLDCCLSWQDTAAGWLRRWLQNDRYSNNLDCPDAHRQGVSRRSQSHAWRDNGRSCDR